MRPLDNLDIWSWASAADRSVFGKPHSENVRNYCEHFSTYETTDINKLS